MTEKEKARLVVLRAMLETRGGTMTPAEKAELAALEKKEHEGE